MTQLLQAKCSNCGANLVMDNLKKTAVCPSCGAQYIISYSTSKPQTSSEANFVKDSGENKVSFADALKNNYNPPEEAYYFEDVKGIVETIKRSAMGISSHSNNLSGYYANGGYDEPVGIYKELDTSKSYYHIEDLGVYKDAIMSLLPYSEKRKICTQINVARALKEIKDCLINEGFKNVVVEERRTGEGNLAYREREMTRSEIAAANRRQSRYKYTIGEKCNDYVRVPRYNLYISIDW